MSTEKIPPDLAKECERIIKEWLRQSVTDPGEPSVVYIERAMNLMFEAAYGLLADRVKSERRVFLDLKKEYAEKVNELTGRIAELEAGNKKLREQILGMIEDAQFHAEIKKGR